MAHEAPQQKGFPQFLSDSRTSSSPSYHEDSSPGRLQALRGAFFVLALFYFLGSVAVVAFQAQTPSKDLFHDSYRILQFVPGALGFLLCFLAFAGAISISRSGTAWRPISTVLLLCHILTTLILLIGIIESAEWVPLPALILSAMLILSSALAIGGFVWCRKSDASGDSPMRHRRWARPLLAGAFVAVLIQALAVTASFCFVSGAAERVRAIMCCANLQSIGRILLESTLDYNRQIIKPLPTSLEDQVLMPMMTCPGAKGETSYTFYLDYLIDKCEGCSEELPEAERVPKRHEFKRAHPLRIRITELGPFDPLAWDTLPRHSRHPGHHVVFADGHVELVMPEQLNKLLQKLSDTVGRKVLSAAGLSKFPRETSPRKTSGSYDKGAELVSPLVLRLQSGVLVRLAGVGAPEDQAQADRLAARLRELAAPGTEVFVEVDLGSPTEKDSPRPADIWLPPAGTSRAEKFPYRESRMLGAVLVQEGLSRAAADEAYLYNEEMHLLEDDACRHQRGIWAAK